MAIQNIIAPCDGTWNGVPTTTNVRRLADIISNLQALNGVINTLGYFQGVGIGGSVSEFFLNGAVASDLGNKIKEAYKFIVINYDIAHTNNVWLFGFSRGAYTVRSVAGIIRNCGIVNTNGEDDESLDGLVNQAYEIYRNRGNECHPDGPVAKEFRHSFSHPGSDASIVFIGLWDTVGAHGLPSYTIGKGFEYLEFYDQFVSSSVKYTYQALAVHENLANFEPCRIFNRPDADNTVVERWFPGVHIDVGGFVFNNPISDVSLNWMIENINNADIPGTAIGHHALGGIIPFVQVSNFPAGIIVRLTRDFVRRLHAVRLVFRDRVIPGLNIEVLYNAGYWEGIARSRDYSSMAYNNFRQLFISRGIAHPPELPV